MTRRRREFQEKESVVVYAGSFSPITNGHLDIIERATFLFDKVVVLVGDNSGKKSSLPQLARLTLVDAAIQHLGDAVTAARLLPASATVDFCKEIGACAMIRGLRTITDFDQEFQVAFGNMHLGPEIETVFLIPKPENHFISSTLIREIYYLKGIEGIQNLVPKPVLKTLREHLDRNKE